MTLPIIVITATYNRCERLEKAINSLICQTDTNWIAIIINDGSSDDTEKYLLTLKDERFITHSMAENSGVNRCRNKALDIIAARGIKGFVTILDDDDIFQENCFSDITKKMSQHTEFKWHTANCVRKNGESISRIKKYGKASYISDYMYGKRVRGDLSHFIHTDIIADKRFTTHFKNSEEWYWFAQISCDHDMLMIDYDAKIVETLPDGLLGSGVNRDKKIEVLRFKLETLKNLVPLSLYSKQAISLANTLAKDNQKDEAMRILANIPFRNKLSYKYLLAKLRSTK